MLAAIIIAVMTIILIIVAETMFGYREVTHAEDEEKSKFWDIFGTNDEHAWYRACIIGGVVGVISYFTTLIGKVPVLAVFFMLAMFAISAYLVWWWRQDGITFKEMICFIILEVLFYAVTMATVSVLVTAVKIKFLILSFEKICKTFLQSLVVIKKQYF